MPASTKPTDILQWQISNYKQQQEATYIGQQQQTIGFAAGSKSYSDDMTSCFLSAFESSPDETFGWTRPTTRTVQVWTEEASSALQDCFECTDWEVFKEGTDLDGYTSSVLSYLKFCTDAVLPTKTIKVFPKQKPWLDITVKPLLQSL
ncbi:hypothetical protein L3Q82_002044 [Scortum barcoo]|uniref:Uncharacterized protein n=1 Tax=Scortum barcoo TaxID=214431 RepID=A0ACB8W1U5_9TELE|nr:hypothetical protein L3Q82_002044 [Scortum barcoo]